MLKLYSFTVKKNNKNNADSNLGVSVMLSPGTKKDAELIGRPIKHKNNAGPKNKLGPASRWSE